MPCISFSSSCAGEYATAVAAAVVVRRRVRLLRGMSLSSSPPLRISMPGGAVASVDEVFVLVARHGRQYHAFLVVRRRVCRCCCCHCRRRWVMSLSSSPPRISLPGGACTDVMSPLRTAPAGGRALTVVSAGGFVAIIYLVACMYLASPPAKKTLQTLKRWILLILFCKKPGLSCAAKSPMVTNKN